MECLINMMHRDRESTLRALIGFIGFMLVAACRNAESVAEPATVYFYIDAPLCSSVIPVQFLVDSALVGSDTFRVHLGGEHLTSRGFTTRAGAHRLSARTGFYTWPEKRVTLGPGEAFTDSLPFYCS
jgi:hypothetical protein